MKHKISFAIMTLAMIFLAIYGANQSVKNQKPSEALSNSLGETSHSIATGHSITKASSVSVASANTTPAVYAAEQKPRPPAETVARVRRLSSKIGLAPAEKAELHSLLSEPETAVQIRNGLNDISLLTQTHLKERLALLDVLYEGLKDLQERERYLELIELLFTDPLPLMVQKDPSLKRQFQGDRVEIAFIASQISREIKEALHARIAQSNQKQAGMAARYLQTAEQLNDTYQVAL